MQNLVEKVVKTEQKNLLLGCIKTELDVDIKDVLFPDKMMDAVQNEEASALFTFFVVKLKQICNTGHASLHKRVETNHQVKKDRS